LSPGLTRRARRLVLKDRKGYQTQANRVLREKMLKEMASDVLVHRGIGASRPLNLGAPSSARSHRDWAIVRSTILSDACNLNRDRFIIPVVAIRRPTPAFRRFDKTANNRIAMHVLQFFDALDVAEDVEIIVADLPERPLAKTFRNRELEGLDRRREWNLAIQRFADEQVNVLGHDDVAEDLEVVTLAGEFERIEKDVF
jgi:hypothetical protein